MIFLIKTLVHNPILASVRHYVVKIEIKARMSPPKLFEKFYFKEKTNLFIKIGTYTASFVVAAVTSTLDQ